MTPNVRTLADFKRFLATPGATVQILRNDWTDPAKTIHPLTPKPGYFDPKGVQKLQSNGVYFTGVARARGGWLEFPKASHARFEGDTVTFDMEQDGKFTNVLVYRLTLLSEPHIVGTEAPTPENDPVGRFKAR